MILDLDRFLRKRQAGWGELETLLNRLEANPGIALDLQSSLRLHYLYQKTGADLERVKAQTSAPQLKGYLEALVARA